MKFISETAWHHEGDYIFFKNLVIDLVTKSKTDIVKLHITLDLEEYIDKNYSLYDSLENWVFDEHQWTEIINIIKNNNKEILFLVNDRKSVSFISLFDPKMIEIHSVCLNDIHLLEAINIKFDDNIKIFIGVGGSTIEEVNNAINILKTKDIVLMHGFQNYPTNYKDINFNKVKKIMGVFSKYKHGYADHTGWNEPYNYLISLCGGFLGMDFLEKHVTNLYGQQRCDWNSAISIEMLNSIIDSWNIIEECNGSGDLELNEAEKKYSVFGPMKKAGFTACEIQQGKILTKDDICFKRTSDISDLSQLEVLNKIGFKIAKSIAKNTLLKKEHFDI